MSPIDTARTDQAQAAAHHADKIVRAVGASTGSPIYEGVVVPWVVEQVTALFRAVGTGRARLCPHVGPRGTIQPLFASAWDPGRLSCRPCADRLPPLDPITDATCDRCARVVQPIYPGTVRVGLVLLGWGFCRRCCRETGMPLHPTADIRSSR